MHSKNPITNSVLSNNQLIERSSLSFSRIASLTWILLTTSFLFALQSCDKEKNILVQPFHKEDIRTIVPLNIYYVSSTDVRSAITVNVNGIPVEVLFDTGSWGLHILKGALSGGSFQTNGQRVSNLYTRGVGLFGLVAKGYVSIGNSRNGAPINFMLIDSANSGGGKFPTGNAAVITNPLLEHFNGIIGVGMRYSDTSKGVASPLPQLRGNGQFIVHFPHYGEPEGSLILNPDRDELVGFSFIKLSPDTDLLPNGLNSWLENQLKGTVYINGKPYANNTLLDTGNPLNLYYKDASSYRVLVPKDTIVRFALGNPVIADTTITVQQQQAGLDLTESDNISPYGPRNVFGAMFFFDFDVFYDQKNGVIGVRKKQ